MCIRDSHLGDDAGNEGNTQLEQLVCDAVVADGADGRICLVYTSSAAVRVYLQKLPYVES